MDCIKFNNNAVSQVFSVLLTLMIVVGTVATIFLWGLPAIESNKFKNSHQSSLGSYDQMYNIMSSLIIDGSDAKGTANIINNNDQGSLIVNPDDGKLVVSYCYDPDYKFDVNSSKSYPNDDLVDGNDIFSLTMENPLTGCEKISIHWLEPGERLSPIEIETLPTKKIYQSNKCAQSFIAPNSGVVGDLDKVMLNISKRETIGGNLEGLNVSIYGTDNGLPDQILNNGVDIIMTIPKNSIPTISSWIECDLPDYTLIQGEEYCIVLEAQNAGGSSVEGNYNYYKWSQTKLYPYDASDSASTYATDTAWVIDSNSGEYKFPFRTQYSLNNPPDTIDTEPDTTSIYSGVEESFDVLASDSIDIEKIKYKFYWGDGTESEDWIEETNLGDGVTEEHTWSEPGTYTLTVQFKDINDNVYCDILDGKEGDYKKQITVNEGDNGYSWPKDQVDEDIHISPSDFDPGTGFYQFTAKKDLEGTLRIDLFNGGFSENFPFGIIWVFNLGSITLDSRKSIGNQQIIFKNGATLSLGVLGNGFKRGPSFFNETVEIENEDVDEVIAFRVFQIGSFSSSAGGIGTYKLALTLKNNFARESNFPTVYDFNMQFHETGEKTSETDLWKAYFKDNYNFEDAVIPGNPPAIQYKDPGNNGRFLIFDNSFIDVQLQGIR